MADVRNTGNQPLTEQAKCVCGYGRFYPWLCKCLVSFTATGRPT